MKNILSALVCMLLLMACDPYHHDAVSVIEIKKDPCFGSCPVYHFTVDGKGQASFHGDRNTSKIGDWTKTLGPVETNALFDAFAKSNFSAFQDEYTANVTDVATTWLTYKSGAMDKTVKDYFGGPEALKALEQLVEAAAETDEGWEKTNDNTEQ